MAATIRRTGQILLPLVDAEDLMRRMGDLTTLEALGQLRRELAGTHVPAEALVMLEKIEAYMRHTVTGSMIASRGSIPFRLTLEAARRLVEAGAA